MSLPSLFISHGSPMLALQPGASGPALARLASQLPKPRAIALVSAHWESRELRVGSAVHPRTWHDFHGFPAVARAVQHLAVALEANAATDHPTIGPGDRGTEVCRHQRVLRRVAIAGVGSFIEFEPVLRIDVARAEERGERLCG